MGVVIAFVIGFAVALIGASIYARATSAHKPARLVAIADELRAISWLDGAADQKAWDTLVGKLSLIFQRELNYYYSQRRKAAIAKFLRWAAWGVGTLGLLCPLLVPLVSGKDSALEARLPIAWLPVPIAPLGYLLIALAGALLAANRFLGLTEGHIRFATTQLQLEAEISALNFGWVAIKAKAASGDPLNVDDTLKLVAGARHRLHEIVLSETQNWATQTAAQEAAHAQSLKAS